MKLKIGMAALFAAALGFAVPGCFAAQPPPQCAVVTSIGSFGIGPYYAKLDNKVSTGTCDEAASSDLTSLDIALARFVKPGDNNFLLAVKNSYLVDVQQGLVYSGNASQANDCQTVTAPGGCAYCIASGTGLTSAFADGGVAVAFLADGGPDVIVQTDGGPGPLRGVQVLLTDGGMGRVSLTNVCKDTDEALRRVDSSDPTRILSFATYPEFPDRDGLCTATGFDGGFQLLDAVPVKGGSLPAIPLASEWTDFSIVNTSKAPATFFTAKLKMTEGSCSTTYDVTAFWPVIHCETLDENGDPVLDANGDYVPDETLCDPSNDYDAGRIYGSGINPALKPKCSPKLAICVPTVTAADLK
jgi:hypothetical protein